MREELLERVKISRQELSKLSESRERRGQLWGKEKRELEEIYFCKRKDLET